MKNLFLGCFVLLLNEFTSAQKSALELSSNMIVDKNFNTYVAASPGIVNTTSIDNRYAFSVNMLYSRSLSPSIAIITGVNNVSRRIDYVRFNSNINGFYYNTFEYKFGLRFYKSFSPQHKFRLDLGPGINYVITSDNATIQGGGTDPWENNIQFIRNSKPSLFTNAALSYESTISNSQAIFVCLQYQHQFGSSFKFKLSNNMFEQYSGGVYPSYISLGVGYKFSFNKTDKEKK
jgi:hypothetical protein